MITKSIALLLSIAVAITSYAQERHTLHYEEELTFTGIYYGMRLGEALTEIEYQTGYTFLHNLPNKLQLKTVKIRLANIPLSQGLDSLLHPLGLDWQRNGNTITLKVVVPLAPVVWGRTRDGSNRPLPNIKVTVSGTNNTTTTDADGNFELEDVLSNAQLVFTGDIIVEQVVRVREGIFHDVVLFYKPPRHPLSFMTPLNNGLQEIKASAATGVFVQPNLRRNVLNTTSLLTNNPRGILKQQDQLYIRGVSTILADKRPLIVLNDVPFDGDINDIDPNEVESINVLKDAAACSIWGVRAANGVIVIKTKKPDFDQKRNTSIGSTLLITPKPNLFKNPHYLAPDEYIDVEKFLYAHGYYNDLLLDPRAAVSPVAQLLFEEQNGWATPGATSDRLDSLASYDVRNALLDHYYRNNITHRSYITANGADSNNAWYVFMGIDQTTTSRTRNGQQRYTINASNLQGKPTAKFSLYTAARASLTNIVNNNPADPYDLRPYTRLEDGQGNPLTVDKDHKSSFPDSADRDKLLPWTYSPLKELELANNKGQQFDINLQANLEYRFNKYLSAKAVYVTERTFTSFEHLQSIETYSTRNLINRFTNIRGNNISYAIARGDILDKSDYTYKAENAGVRLQYRNDRLQVLLGGDNRLVDIKTSFDRLYGYDSRRRVNIEPNYSIRYPIYGTTDKAFIENPDDTKLRNENYQSAYLSANYTWQKNLVVSGSIRQDLSNTYWSASGKRFDPLWSAGVNWSLERKKYYARIRGTYGISGNIYKEVSSSPTIRIVTNTQSNQVVAEPATLPNEALRAERTAIANLGMDLVAANNRWSLNADYYIRQSNNLFGYLQTSPDMGVENMVGNFAGMRGHGFEVNLAANGKLGGALWSTGLSVNYAKDKVTKYQGSPGKVADYFKPLQLVLRENYPVNAVFSVKVMGLDPGNGKLIGMKNGLPTTDLQSVLQSTNTDSNLVFHGTSIPLYFGNLTHTFTWKNFSATVVISYKLKYVFRRTSIRYNDLFQYGVGHTDLLLRWKETGDEKNTIIPAMQYPADKDDDTYFSFSNLLVEKGDHVRLQELQFTYSLTPKLVKWLPFRQLQINAGADNLGIIWRKNKHRIDPDYPNEAAPGPTFIFGVKANFGTSTNKP